MNPELLKIDGMRSFKLRLKYPELMKDFGSCRWTWLLKRLVGYRLQKSRTGLSISEASMSFLAAVSGKCSPDRKTDLPVGFRLVVTWKERDYVCYVREDGRIAYGDCVFETPGEVAKLITGSERNVRKLFGVDKHGCR